MTNSSTFDLSNINPGDLCRLDKSIAFVVGHRTISENEVFLVVSVNADNEFRRSLRVMLGGKFFSFTVFPGDVEKLNDT